MNDAAARDLIRDGTALAAASRWDEAAALLGQALALAPNAAEAHHQLGLVRAAQGRSSEAVLSWLCALTAEPGHGPANLHLGLALMDKGCRDEARKCLQLAAARNVIEAYRPLADLLESEGHALEAAACRQWRALMTQARRAG